MSIVVTTPTGNIGRVVVEQLLAAGEKPTIIARNPEKVKSFADRGATVIAGTHRDAALLTKATKGARALFHLCPPDFQVQDLRAHYREFVEPAVKAIAANGIGHVVHLSSVGAEHQSGTGPIIGIYEAEQRLNDTAANVLHLRPGYFMENTLGQIPSILQASALFTTFPENAPIPMVATRDIGAAAAGFLRQRDWSGKVVRELHGAGPVSYDDVARVLSEVLGRDLKHVTVTPAQQREALTAMGLSAVLADSFGEMADAMKAGKLVFHEAPSAANRTETTYPIFAQQVFKPAFDAVTAG